MYSHFSLKSNIQSFLQLCAGGLFVLVESVGINIQRGGGLAMTEDARYRGHIRAARDHQTGGGVPERMDVQLLRQAVLLEDQLEAVGEGGGRHGELRSLTAEQEVISGQLPLVIRPARCIWQGSGFAADQTNAMLATSNGGDKISRNRNSLRLSGITVYAEIFHLRQRNEMFLHLAFKGLFPLLTALFWQLYAGWYHYPRRALHAVETLDARGSRRRIRRFYAAPEFALCGQNIPAAGTTPPIP